MLATRTLLSMARLDIASPSVHPRLLKVSSDTRWAGTGPDSCFCPRVSHINAKLYFALYFRKLNTKFKQTPGFLFFLWQFKWWNEPLILKSHLLYSLLYIFAALAMLWTAVDLQVFGIPALPVWQCPPLQYFEHPWNVYFPCTIVLDVLGDCGTYTK